MGRAVAWGIAVVAAGAAAALALRLWRLRKTASGMWRTEHYLTALGVVIALLGVVLPLLVVEDDTGDSAEVTRYRHDVRAACASLQPTTNPLLEAMDPQGNVDRTRLEQGFRNQLTAAQGVLAVLWERTPPPELAEDTANAREAADALVAATTGTLDRMASELADTSTFAEAAAYIGGMDAELRPAASRFEAAMSQLADQPCQAPPVSQAE